MDPRALALADFDAYRQRHWAHHKNLGLETDTKDAYLVELGGSGTVQLLLRCLSLREAGRKLAHQGVAPAGEEHPVARGRRWPAPPSSRPWWRE